ncbi:MAG: TM2 domain-containing protein [Tenacibaculum sp.]
MGTQKVDMFITSNGKYFESNQINNIRDKLLALDESKWASLSTIQFKNPATTFIISFFLGGLGVDRFTIGDTGLGVAKLLTCGGLGVWSIIDLFIIKKATRERNAKKIGQLLN